MGVSGLNSRETSFFPAMLEFVMDDKGSSKAILCCTWKDTSLPWLYQRTCCVNRPDAYPVSKLFPNSILSDWCPSFLV